jgi:N-acetylglucosaminyldiphosphoundecaprenol N-acetyl-beta-D-mannosaminyltransferase
MTATETRAVVPAPIRFAGMPIHPVTVDDTVRILAARAPDAPFAAYITPSIGFIYLQRQDAAMRAAMEAAFVSSNDSRILHRLGRIAGLELEFAPGSYVVRRMFEDGVIEPSERICVVGVTPDIVDKLKARFGLTDVAHHIPPMGFIHDETAVQAAVDFIATHPSRFVMVAMGPPQSEKLCLRTILDGRSTGVGLCIGSSLLVVSGEGAPAPDWMERSGLVWLYRLVCEPRRLWKRYVLLGGYGVLVALADAVAIRLKLKGAHA